MSLTFSSDFDAFSWQTFQIHFPIHFYSVDLVAVKVNYFENPIMFIIYEPISIINYRQLFQYYTFVIEIFEHKIYLKTDVQNSQFPIIVLEI